MPKEAPVDLGPHRWFQSAIYLGGSSKFSEGWHGVLFFTTKAIGLGKGPRSGPKETVIPIETVASVEVTGRQVAKSKVGAVLIFGVYGLATKGSMDETTVAIRTKDGETIYYAIAQQRPEMVRVLISPILKLANVPFHDEPPSAATPPAQDMADQLRKLAALRDEGLLTDDEFAAQKGKLLNQ
jgi:Short C-terminal domain